MMAPQVPNAFANYIKNLEPSNAYDDLTEIERSRIPNRTKQNQNHVNDYFKNDINTVVPQET